MVLSSHLSKLSVNQLCNAVLVNLLFFVRNKRDKKTNYDIAKDNLIELKKRVSEDKEGLLKDGYVGKLILQKLDEAFDSPNTIWYNRSDFEKKELSRDFKKYLKELMLSV